MGDTSAATPRPIRVADRRLQVRYEGIIAGSYTLSSRRRHEGEADVQVFACRTRDISPAAAAVTAPVLGSLGELITARFDGLGIMRGHIEQHLDDGFVLAISASEQQRRKLAGQISELKRRSAAGVLEKRSYRRLQPVDPRSAITLDGGPSLRCFVVDFSRSGAAVSADCAPPVGTRVILGVLASRVVRHLVVGFTVRFDAVQDAEGLESLITGFAPGSDARYAAEMVRSAEATAAASGR
jgi:hypothetical protein